MFLRWRLTGTSPPMRSKVHSSVDYDVAVRNHMETRLPDWSASLDVRYENKCNDMFGMATISLQSRAESFGAGDRIDRRHDADSAWSCADSARPCPRRAIGR